MREEHSEISGHPRDPLGDRLVEQVLEGEERQEALRRAAALPHLMIDREGEITLEMIATGVFSPITGFLPRAENESVLEVGRLMDGTPWPIPLSMAPTGRRNRQVLAGLEGGEEIALVNRRGETVALLEVEEIYPYDREQRATRLFGTDDPEEHPGVAGIYRRMGEWGLAGRVRLVDRPSWGAFEEYRMTPRRTRELLYAEGGVGTVAGFITGANPPHIGHEHMHRVVLEQVDRILLLPQVAMERPEYIKAHHRVMALEALRGVYYPMHRVIINALRTNYVFAGPREAVLHAIVMRNYGCTHAVIGRDHAGVGDIYDLYAGQRAFEEYTEDELGIKPVFFLEVFYCTRCRAAATEKTCPHDSRYRMQISGTGIREILRRGYLPPKEICRPEVAHVAIQGVVPQGTDEEGQSIYPVGQTMHSLFPFYEVSTRLGGYLRREIVDPATMGERDLEAALLDARTHADSVYSDTFAEVAAAAEVNRSLAERWRTEAREILVDHQAEVVDELEGKSARLAAGGGEPTGETAEDVEEELRVAREILSRHPRPLHQDQACLRILLEEPYHSYRPESETREDSETGEYRPAGEYPPAGEDPPTGQEPETGGGSSP